MNGMLFRFCIATVGADRIRPRRQCRRTMTLRPLYQYVDSLPRPVTYHSKTGLHTSTGVDEQSTRHTSTPKGRFVLRADSIRPYGAPNFWTGQISAHAL